MNNRISNCVFNLLNYPIQDKVYTMRYYQIERELSDMIGFQVRTQIWTSSEIYVFNKIALERYEEFRSLR